MPHFMTGLLIQENLPKHPHFSDLDMIYLVFLLKKIGFKDEARLIAYLEAVIKVYGKYEKTRISQYRGGGSITNYNSSRCFGLLKVEIAIRENLERIIPIDSKHNSLVSATDLASFCFCPVSYCISKSLEVKFPTNLRSRSIGNDLHEQLRLISRLPKEYLENTDSKYYTPQAQKIKKIRGCKLIFAGHTKERKVFINESVKFIGQPDYIFQDPNGDYFVVEEKFHADQSGEYDNHLVQLQAYIKYISDYDIKYGVLINWSYDFHFQTYEPFINDVKVKVVKIDKEFSLLTRIHHQLKTFQNKKELSLPFKPNINKCVSCVVNKYCSHKAGNLKKVSLPYDKENLRLQEIIPPEILFEYIEDTPSINVEDLYYEDEYPIILQDKIKRRKI